MILQWRSLAENNEALEQAVAQALDFQSVGVAEPLMTSTNTRCKVMVLTMPQSEIRIPVRLRSYASRTDPDDGISTHCTVMQAALATMALPTKYNAVKIGNSSDFYVSAGLGYVNPAKEALDEAKRIWQLPALECLVSLGSGKTIPASLHSDLRNNFVGVISFVSALSALATDTTRVHTDLAREADHLNIKYFRFEVLSGLEHVHMDEWKKLAYVETKTRSYLKDKRVGADIGLCVQFLQHISDANQTEMRRRERPAALNLQVGPLGYSGPNSGKAMRTYNNDSADCFQGR
jgi:hypothetical protein